MQRISVKLAVTAVFAAAAVLPVAGSAGAGNDDSPGQSLNVQLGPRPFYLVDQMSDGELKERLESCADGEFRRTDFAIGHRGAPLQFPEHTRESYEAAARMGAGILECDVTFTKDLELVCRHAQCDLHTTTNILASDLAGACSQPFTPAEFDPETGARTAAASARCCTSDISLAEFKTLEGKMDASDRDALTVEDYLGGTANWRTDLYATGGTLLSHAESIALFKELGVKFAPELKAPGVAMPFKGLTQDAYAQKMIDEYKAADVAPEQVWAQSFNLEDLRYWIANEPAFGAQAVFLDDRYAEVPPIDPNDPGTFDPSMDELVAMGVRIVAPPMWMLLSEDDGKIVPSAYAKAAKATGLEIITWTLERSGRIAEDVLEGGNSFYYQSILGALENDGDILVTLDVLAQQVGVRGIFTDWPATVTYYANCMKL